MSVEKKELSLDKSKSWMNVEDLATNWDVDTSSMGPEDLTMFCVDVFKASGCLDALKISEEVVHRFVRACQAKYKEPAFHNFQHASLVMHSSLLLVRRFLPADSLSEVELLALLVAALGHDLGHPGLSNYYHVQIQSPLASMYPIGTLEKHHCDVLRQILTKDSTCNVFSILSEERKAYVWHFLDASIMSTDMSTHDAQLEDLRKAVDGAEEWMKDRVRLSRVILHTADLCGPLKRHEVDLIWVGRLKLEWDEEIRLLQEANKPTLPFMHIDSEASLYQGEINFINSVVMPWWEALRGMCATFQDGINRLNWQVKQYERML